MASHSGFYQVSARLNRVLTQLLQRNWRFRSFLFVVLSSGPLGTATADEPRRYGGYVLSEWREIIKSNDFRTLGEPGYVAGLIQIVADVEAPWASRRQAAETLGRIGLPASQAVPLLHSLLISPGEEELSTRLWVLKSLALFGEVAVETTDDVSRLALDAAQPHLVRLSALGTLGRVGKNRTTTLSTFSELLRKKGANNSSLPDELRLGAAEAIWLLGPAAAVLLPDLMDAAVDEWAPLRLATIVTIGEIGSRAEIAIPLLVDTILFDESGEVQEVAADALGKVGDASLLALERLLSDPEIEVRRLVIRALRQMRESPEVHRLLVAALQDDSGLVRVASADELLNRDLENRSAHLELLTSLGSQDRRTSLNAYLAINRHFLKSHELIKRLKSLFNDPDANEIQRRAAKKLILKHTFTVGD